MMSPIKWVKNGTKYQYIEDKLKTRGEITSGTFGLLITPGKAGNVKCNINILEDLNTNIRRPIMKEDRNDPSDRHKSSRLLAALIVKWVVVRRLKVEFK